MNIVHRTWQKIVPYPLLVWVRFILEPKNLKERRLKVLAYFDQQDQKTLEPEIIEGIKYLRSHKFASFPFRWTQKYDTFMPEVHKDTLNNHYYVVFENKRMYFPKGYNETKVIWSYRSILKEQDAESSHLYLNKEFDVELDSIVIDAGVAEGNFALSVVERAKKVFLIECESEWMEALRLTFEPWKEKVVFVQKFMSDVEGDDTVSIDSLVSPSKGDSYFVKLDIEGFEQKALAGMKNLVASGNPLKLDVCTYHQPEAFDEISALVENYGFRWNVTKGFVLFFQPGEVPSFRKVLIRAEK
jgi:hypothetical protein